MRFIVDNQLPVALAGWLTAKGHASEHVGHIGLTNAGDTDIWRAPVERGAVILTCDSDFAHPRLTALPRPPVVLFRFGNLLKPALLARVAAVLPDVLVRLNEGDLLIEVR